MLRPEPRPELARPARSPRTGRRQRSTSREATIPTTPGCQPSPATTIAAACACGAHAPSAAKRIRVSASRRSRLSRSSSRATSAARASSSVSSSSSAASARCMRPAALMRGPSRKPERVLGDVPGLHRGHLHERAQSGPSGAGERRQALADDAAVLAAERHEVADGGERGQVEVLSAPPPGPCPPPTGGPRTASAPPRPRTARGTGSPPRAGCTTGQSGQRRAGPVVVGDHHVEPRARAPRPPRPTR